MRIAAPAIITPRLLPGLQIGGAFVSIDYAKRPGREYRTRYHWFIDLPSGEEFDSDDMQSGNGGGSLQEGLKCLVDFLGACAEGVRYQTSTGRQSENADLFPPAIAEWAAQYSDELSAIAWELEEGQPTTIDEDE